jgi:glycosyltransferase involved in cell wall biosynthesis
MIAHGYPHGRRQDLLGKRIHADRAPSDLQIITVSEFSARLFRRMWGTEKRGINVQAIWSSCGQPVQAFMPLAGRNLSVVTASLVESYKEPFYWINIADNILRGSAGLESADFTWLGDGPLLQQARERAIQTGHQSIRFPGWDEEPGKAYMHSRAYLQPSSKEALGLSVVDAVRHGLPSVVTNVGGLPEVSLDSVNGFVVPAGDTVAASEAVKELLLDDSTWLRMSSSANEVYRQRFTPEMWKQKMLVAHES